MKRSIHGSCTLDENNYCDECGEVWTDADFPTVAELAGSDPDFTGGLEASEYVRRLRGYPASGSDEQGPT